MQRQKYINESKYTNCKKIIQIAQLFISGPKLYQIDVIQSSVYCHKKHFAYISSEVGMSVRPFYSTVRPSVYSTVRPSVLFFDSLKWRMVRNKGETRIEIFPILLSMTMAKHNGRNAISIMTRPKF